MTVEEYKVQLKQAEFDYEATKRNLHVIYAKSQRKFNIGDIINQDDKYIEITKFGSYIPFACTEASPKYIGKALTKKLEYRKNLDTDTIYGNNNTKLIKPASSNPQ